MVNTVLIMRSELMLKSLKKTSAGDKMYLFCCYLFIIFVCIITVYPFVYVVSASLSPASDIMRSDVILLPKHVTWRAYDVVVHYTGLWTAYANTVFYTVAGTAISIILTALGAYPLSKKRWKARRVFSLFIVFTM